MLNLEDLEHTPNSAVREKWCTLCVIGTKYIRFKNGDTPTGKNEEVWKSLLASLCLDYTYKTFTDEFALCKSAYVAIKENIVKVTDLRERAKKSPTQVKNRYLNQAVALLEQNKNLAELILRSPIFKIKTYER